MRRGGFKFIGKSIPTLHDGGPSPALGSFLKFCKRAEGRVIAVP